MVSKARHTSNEIILADFICPDRLRLRTFVAIGAMSTFFINLKLFSQRFGPLGIRVCKKIVRGSIRVCTPNLLAVSYKFVYASLFGL